MEVIVFVAGFVAILLLPNGFVLSATLIRDDDHNNFFGLMCIVVDDFDVMFLYYQRCDVAEKKVDQK